MVSYYNISTTGRKVIPVLHGIWGLILILAGLGGLFSEGIANKIGGAVTIFLGLVSLGISTEVSKTDRSISKLIGGSFLYWLGTLLMGPGITVGGIASIILFIVGLIFAGLGLDLIGVETQTKQEIDKRDENVVKSSANVEVTIRQETSKQKEKMEENKYEKYLPTWGEKIRAKVLRIIDSDTIECDIEEIEIKRIRLIGIDAPESDENDKLNTYASKYNKSALEIIRLGNESKKFAERLLPKGSKVFLEFDSQKLDMYERLLAYVWLENGKMLNKITVEEGYADVFIISPNTKYATELLEAQKIAKLSRKGMWR